MRWFHNLTTGAKLHLGFGTMLLFIAMTSWIANSVINRLQASVSNLYDSDFRLALEMSEMRANLARARLDQLELLALPAGSERTALIDNMKRNSTDLDSRLLRVTNLAISEVDLSGRLGELKRTLSEYQKMCAKKVSAAPVEGGGIAADAGETHADLVLFDKLRDLTVAIGQVAQDRAAAHVQASVSEGEHFSVTFITLAAVAFLCSTLLVLLLHHTIVRPLTRISGMAERIAAGDLTIEMPDSGRKDEVGIMQATFSKMVSGLRDVTRQIREATAVLAASGTEILAATTQLASSASETASAVAQTTTTLEEVKQTSQVSSQKAKTVSEEARKAAEVAGTGRESVEQTIEGMESIQHQMSAIADSIVNLSTQSQSIGEIITSVDDLAAQSKLLAVNASIEAAKAGEEGKGFSVVAQEVKSLAEQSKQATAQVRGILSDIQKATSNVVLAAERGGKAVEAGVSQSARAGESIHALTENIAHAAQAATQIAATSQQQYVGVDQVTLAMENIKAASTQTVVSTRQAEAAAQQIHDLGQNLKLIVDRFKI
jgi:methyl-accepting chemotaxis protein